MSYKTITSFLPNAERVAPLVDALLPLAHANGAHLVGLHIIPRIVTVYSGYAGVSFQIPEEVVEQQRSKFRKRAAETEQAFLKQVEQSDVSTEWQCVDSVYGNLAQDVARFTGSSDLTVIGLELGDDPDAWSELPANVAIETGRPVLTIPNPDKVETIGKRVLVAWNDSREAARAAFDAIPLMINSDMAKVLSIAPDDNDIARGEPITRALARHAIKAESIVVEDPRASVGDEIVERLKEYECDLLVMGCYGHSRIRETLLGGATRHLLQRMPVPVLFSH